MQHNVTLNPVQLDPSTALKITMGGSMFQERSLMGRPDVWHKIKVIRGARYEKDFILKLIINAIEPADLIPVRYHVSGQDSAFIARNCGLALDKLCRSNLIINNPNGDPLIIDITLGFASIHDLKVNIQALLLAALNRRYDSKRKILHLDRFHKDIEMSKTVYCPLSQLRTFSYVLKVAKNALNGFEHLNLQHNELLSLSSIESSNLSPMLKSLDLRYNNLMGMEALTPLRGHKITDIWLDGNPVCENYSSPEKYIESARRYCPHLTKLDGVYIGAPGMPLTYNTYFSNGEKKKLVNQFVHHFFTLYDQSDRMILRGLYHQDALYSMTLGIPPALAAKKNLNKFIVANRNLTKLTDFAKSHQLLFRGPEAILKALNKLPQSSHDRTTFKCDLLYDCNNHIAITVEGVLRVLDNKTTQVLSFNRTFILREGEDDEYNIVNDQYHVDFGPLGRLAETYQDEAIKNISKSSCFSRTEKNELIETLRDVSTMNREWCSMYLEDAGWNLRKAIADFVENYKKSGVPPEAFQK
ncbi:nuclear RNA export factor 1 [Neodiprion lecontei]|uniref:Nuclear RNA export factor 1 n=1 Tax=Neodiprion lecontei TaxID=441921 RepID=A0A6J0BR86_NEOLC|nr:nuclear RNA export factor 1 [Neodiprion lecontei]